MQQVGGGGTASGVVGRQMQCQQMQLTRKTNIHCTHRCTRQTGVAGTVSSVVDRQMQ